MRTGTGEVVGILEGTASTGSTAAGASGRLFMKKGFLLDSVIYFHNLSLIMHD